MILGIDLGTTNSAAAIIKDGKPIFVKTKYDKNEFLLPSIVAYDENGKILVGPSAKKRYSASPNSAIRSVKNHMGTKHEVTLYNEKKDSNEIFTPVEISSYILAEIKKLAEEQFKTNIEKAVITVPAYFDDRARKDTIKAGELAGFEVMRIINEPTAAALCYGTKHKTSSSQYIMVYDLGGGTFDTSIIEINGDIVEVVASDGDRDLGGDNFDKAVFTALYSSINQKGTSALNDIKNMTKILTEAELTKNSLTYGVKHKINITELNFQETLYREDFEKLIADLLKRTLNHCKSVIAKSKLKPQDISKILLVGGSSRIPAVKEMLETELGIPTSQEVDPDLAVVTGAAIQSAIIEGKSVGSVLLDVAPHSISVSCVIERNGKVIPNYCSKIIKKNTPIPCTVEEIFSTLNEDQDTVRIAIYQGESDFEEDNLLIKELRFDCSKSKKKKGTDILVSFSYGLDGTIQINVREEGTQNKTTHKVELLNNKDSASNTLQ